MIDTPEDVIRRSIQEHSVVIHGTLFHNIHETTWRSRLLGRMVSAVPIPIALEGGDSIPEGPVSPYHFCFFR